MMTAAIRQTVTVGPGGRIEVRSPDLAEGSRAEVIVLVEQSPESISRKLGALDKLQKSLNLDEQKMREWMGVVREEREAFGP